MNPKYTAAAAGIDKTKFTPRNAAEIEAVTKLANGFRVWIEHNKGVDRQIIVDALEYLLWDHLVDCFDSDEEFDGYIQCMRERGHGMFERRNLPGEDEEAGA